jgi:hypothetical protein
MQNTRSAKGALSIERNEGGTVRWYLAPTTAPAPERLSPAREKDVSAVAASGRLRAPTMRRSKPRFSRVPAQAFTEAVPVLPARVIVVGKKW